MKALLLALLLSDAPADLEAGENLAALACLCSLDDSWASPDGPFAARCDAEARRRLRRAREASRALGWGWAPRLDMLAPLPGERARLAGLCEGVYSDWVCAPGGPDVLLRMQREASLRYAHDLSGRGWPSGIITLHLLFGRLLEKP